MTSYISQLGVSLNKVEEENLSIRGFKKIQGDLNKGAGGKDIYLWYKEGPKAITKLQITFNNAMATGLNRAGYIQINKDLNAGAGGDDIHLWSYQGSGEYDTPIVDIDVTTDGHSEAAKFGFGWERLSCDLNRKARGADIHIWVKREKQTYICDITASKSYASDPDLLRSHYIRVDEDINRGAGGSDIFIWYRQTTDPKRALTDLKVSTNDTEALEYQQQQYSNVKVNFNDGAKGNVVYLWYKKEECSDPIKAIALLLDKKLIKEYRSAGLIVIEKDFNTGNDGKFECLCVYQ